MSPVLVAALRHFSLHTVRMEREERKGVSCSTAGRWASNVSKMIEFSYSHPSSGVLHTGVQRNVAYRTFTSPEWAYFLLYLVLFFFLHCNRSEVLCFFFLKIIFYIHLQVLSHFDMITP